METIQGKSILNKIAIGRILYHRKSESQVVRRGVSDVREEIGRYEEALRKAEAELEVLYEKACQEVGKVNAAVFEVHKMMLTDEDYRDSVYNIITSQRVNAEYAVAVTADNFRRLFSEMEDEYFKARAVDVKDVSDRLLTLLSGNSLSGHVLSEPVILAAYDLAPSETVQLEKDMLLGFVTEQGSLNSHTAILARTMNIPALVSVPVKEEWDGKTAVIDGETGTLYIDPDEDFLRKMGKKKEDEENRERLLMELKDEEDVTLDGTRIRLYGNIGSVSDVADVLKYNAAGIGLFRSEFLYMDRLDFPTEEEQFQVYRQGVQAMDGRKVIIRTLDMGADKQADYFKLEKEENPAMGYRGIRICLKQTDIFKTQLRALLRAAVYGNLSIMYPMIISVEEVRKIQELVQEVQKELEDNQIPCRLPEQGIMIETPAAVMVSDELAELVDFFSIGTNDLTQYTLAVDRQNGKLEDFYQPHHKAILRMIQMVVENAHKRGIWVGICGELAADLALTEVFLRMGVDELSMAPSMVLKVREVVRGLNLSGIL